MSVRETQELEAAAQKLSLEILKKSLEANGGDPAGKKEEILHRLGNKVLEIGLEGFLDGLGKDCLKDLCEQIKPKEGGTRKKESPKTKLFRHILEKGLEYFLQDCAKEQLNNFCSVLLLEQSSNDAMVSQIADEVMLTGTKKYLHNLALPLLKKWCLQLGLKPAASKKQLVEQLMVHIFELEPLDEEEEDEGEGEADGDRGGRGKKRIKQEEREQLDDDDDDYDEGKGEEGDDRKETKDVDAATKKDQGSLRREKYVPPPISTIKKGMTKEHLHNTFNATDLKEFCKQNNMTSSGKKPLLIKRILKFLETGEIEAPKARRGAKRKRPIAEKSSDKRTKSNEPSADNEEDEDEPDDGRQEKAEGKGVAEEGDAEQTQGRMNLDEKDGMMQEQESSILEETTPVAASTADASGGHQNGDSGSPSRHQEKHSDAMVVEQTAAGSTPAPSTSLG